MVNREKFASANKNYPLSIVHYPFFTNFAAK